MLKRNLATLLLAISCTAVPLTSRADVIYNNSVNDLTNRFSPGTLEVGEEIVFGGSARFLTNFAFEFFGTNTISQSIYQGNVEARVRFYAMDGQPFNGYTAPGTSLFDTEWFPLAGPTTRATLNFNAGAQLPTEGLFLPNSITWSVQFRGMSASDTVGLDIYGPSTVGSNFNDYWENTGAGWVLRPMTAVNGDFAAIFQASPVPEPSTSVLAFLGGLAILAVVRCRL